MKLTLRAMATDAPAQTGNPEVFEREVLPDEASAFLSRHVSSQDIIHLEDPHGSIDFWKHDALWATSQVNEIEARAIIDMLAREDNFGYCIPTTMREWDAFAPLDDTPIQKGGPAAKP